MNIVEFFKLFLKIQDYTPKNQERTHIPLLTCVSFFGLERRSGFSVSLVAISVGIPHTKSLALLTVSPQKKGRVSQVLLLELCKH